MQIVTHFQKACHISNCLELAILLESSAHKPGNVSVVTNFEKTRYEHFLASAVAAAASFQVAAERGVAVSTGKLPVQGVGVGQIIRDCIEEIDAWQHGGNTLLGTVILLTPIAVAAGMTPTEKGTLKIGKLRKNLGSVAESTTPEDAVNLYEAIRIARPSGLGNVSDLDVNNPASIAKIRREKITLYHICEIASKYDIICYEWVNNFTVTFDIAHPSLKKQIEANEDISSAIIHTFLEVLAKVPDTFIARKAGLKKAREISLEAEEILRLGGLKAPEGRKRLNEFDEKLRSASNLLNPGTTADIIAAALALCILEGYRP